MDKLYEGLYEILACGSPDSREEVRLIVEDAESPIRGRLLGRLYQSLMDQGHIDFSGIEKSAGDIVSYSGYRNMLLTLKELRNLPGENIRTTNTFLSQIDTVETAIINIRSSSPIYRLAFIKHSTPIMLEYNSMVAACVSGTTALLYTFVDYLNDPKSGEVKEVMKDAKSGGGFYIDQLSLFNQIVKTGNHRKYLAAVVNNGISQITEAPTMEAMESDNGDGVFTESAFVVGAVAIAAAIAVSIVPLTRRLIYSFQNLRRRLTDCLELQAYYLELNQSIVEANQTMSRDKKDKVLAKQNELRLKFLRLADKIRVESIRNEELTRKNLEKDNKVMSIDNIRDEISTDDIVLL